MAYKSERALLTDLADNTAKDISAGDVSSIVDSMYQPKLIYAGRVDDDAPTSIDYYFDPNFFQKKGYDGSTSGKAITDASQIYQFTNVGAGIADGWSGEINGTKIGATGAGEGLRMKVFGAGGVVTDYEIIRQGGGYRPGDVIEFAVGGSSTNPQITYRGVIRYSSAGVYDMTFNNDNGNHTQINSIVNMVPYDFQTNREVEDLYARVGDLSSGTPPAYSNPNKLYARCGWDDHHYAINIQIWRINGNV